MTKNISEYSKAELADIIYEHCNIDDIRYARHGRQVVSIVDEDNTLSVYHEGRGYWSVQLRHISPNMIEARDMTTPQGLTKPKTETQYGCIEIQTLGMKVKVEHRGESSTTDCFMIFTRGEEISKQLVPVFQELVSRYGSFGILSKIF